MGGHPRAALGHCFRPTFTIPDTAPIELADIRTDYRRGKLRRTNLHEDPIEQFNRWLKNACDAGIPEPTAVSLATAGTDGRPPVRTVLLKGLDARGFAFFSNLESCNARQLAENSHAALLFPWLALERQVIVTGHAEKLSTVEDHRVLAGRREPAARPL